MIRGASVTTEKTELNTHKLVTVLVGRDGSLGDERMFNKLFTKLWAECRDATGRVQDPGLVGVDGHYHP